MNVDLFILGVIVGLLPSMWLVSKWQTESFKRRVAESDLTLAKQVINILRR